MNTRNWPLYLFKQKKTKNNMSINLLGFIQINLKSNVKILKQVTLKFGNY